MGLDRVQHALPAIVAHSDVLRVRCHVAAPVVHPHIPHYLRLWVTSDAMVSESHMRLDLKPRGCPCKDRLCCIHRSGVPECLKGCILDKDSHSTNGMQTGSVGRQQC